MHYDQSWMADGWTGGLEAGALSALAAGLLFLLLQWLNRDHRGLGATLGWSVLLATLLTASGDLWDLFYFSYARLQSLALLRAKLALVHDPESLGIRVLCELLGVALGLYLGWLLRGARRRRHVGDQRE